MDHRRGQAPRRTRAFAGERARRWLLSLAAGLPLVFPIAGAQAAPDDTALDAYQLPCGVTTCEGDGSRLRSDDVVSGSIQLQASSQSTLGLERVEIQMNVSGDWRCLNRWSTGTRSGRWTLDLDTRDVIRGCDGERLTDGRNGSYRLRTLATDRSGSQGSPSFGLRLSNPPVPPAWASDPAPIDDEGPVVTLRWYRNPEPDIVEYHFARTGPGGTSEYAVSAERPGGQGCDLDGSVYTCTDDDFPASSYDGRYSYSLLAFRASPDGSRSCSLPGTGSCVYSGSSSERAVTFEAPPPPPRIDPREEQRRDGPNERRQPRPARERAGPPSLSDLASGDFNFETGTYERSLPYDAPAGGGLQVLPNEPPASEPEGQALDQELAGSIEQERQRRNLLAIAGGLLLLVLATQLTRTLRRSSRTGR